MKGVPHPNVTTESGRALASHHSVLVFEVLNGSAVRRQQPPTLQQELELSILRSPDAAERDYRESDYTQSGGSSTDGASAAAAPGGCISSSEWNTSSTRSNNRSSSNRESSSSTRSSDASGSGRGGGSEESGECEESGGSRAVGEQWLGGEEAVGLLSGRSDTRAADFLLSTFAEVLHTMDSGNFQEALNDAKQFKKEAGALFKLGCMSLPQRAQVEGLYEVRGRKGAPE